MSTQPPVAHQHACGAVVSSLICWSQASGAGFAYATPGLVFAEDNDVVPDVVWISRARLAEALDEHGHLRIAPEPVVEVQSPGTPRIIPLNLARRTYRYVLR